MKRILVFLTIWVLGQALLPKTADAYPLTEAQEERLRRFIPRSFAKLQNREPVHILVLGDSISTMYSPDDANGNWHLAYHREFAFQLSREFFYPGEVRLINPPKGLPEKKNDLLGDEILLENRAIAGRCAIDALQRVYTDAFVNDPDLVMIEYGINDAMTELTLDTYAAALNSTIDECQRYGLDVIVLGPNMVKQAPGPTEWGLVRSHASVAREVARQQDVLFVDLGEALARVEGVSAGRDPQEAIEEVGKKMEWIFDYGSSVTAEERIHPNRKAHEMMGQVIFEQLMNGEPPYPYGIVAKASFKDESTMETTVTVKNTSDVVRKGYLGALAVRRCLTPVNPYQSFELKPGQSTSFEISYLHRGRSEDRGNLDYFPLEPADSRIRFPFILADEKQSCVLTATSPVLPVGVIWQTGLDMTVTDKIRLTWRFVNPGKEPVEGTYRISLGDSNAGGRFSIEPGGDRKFFAEFNFRPEPGMVRQRMPVDLNVETAGRKFDFNRDMEVTKDLVLGEVVALSQFEEYVNEGVGRQEVAPGKPGVTLRADVDEKWMYYIFDFHNVDLVSSPDSSSIIADINIDARDSAECRQFGFVDKIRVATNAEDGPGRVDNPQMAVFGNSYNYQISADGIACVMQTMTDGNRRLSVRIPRAYFYRHSWVTDPAAGLNGIMGLNVNLSLLSVDAEGVSSYPPDKRFTLAASDLYLRDPRGFITLRLSRTPVETWSARLY